MSAPGKEDALTNPDAVFARALEAHRNGRLDEAEEAYGAILRQNPDHAPSLHTLGMIAAQLGRHGEALDLIERSIALNPAVAEAHYNRGVALHALLRIPEALEAYRRALSLKPNVAGTHLQVSVALQELGRSEEALAAVDTALALDPTSAPAWHVRSDLASYAKGDPRIGQMEALRASAFQRQVSAEDLVLLEFALGKAWADAGDPDRSFAFFQAANRRKRAFFRYDVGEDEAWFSEIARAMGPETLRRLGGSGDPSDAPVFIVGMPRSGTTLVEQILSSHPQVHGAGELLVLEELTGRDWERDDLRECYDALVDRLDKPMLRTLGSAYVERVTALTSGEARVIDKSPGNFRLAGLIRLMLPNARIIHCRRDPMDTCFSCYARNFSGRVRYAFDLFELGRYYRAYRALMDHWRTVLPPDRFLEVDYEEVVSDLEPQARRLVAFCGLDWDPACLNFHTSKRLVRTLSVNQVRRPIYKSSVARWTPYAAHLAPLVAALGEETPLKLS